MTLDVKICGLKTIEALDATLEGGAAFFGLVFFPPSPRALSFEQAALLADHARVKRSAARSVAVCVDPDNTLLDNIIHAANPDYIQLHGSETLERMSEIRAQTGKKLIKAIKVRDEGDLEDISAFIDASDIILFDAKADPKLYDLPGGNGLSFNWSLLRQTELTQPFMLSGGLTIENSAQAVNQSGAQMVDVSSGVEHKPGEKDPKLIEAFLRHVRHFSELEQTQS